MSWQNDAREFGLHIKQGGWRLGLLVARNVEMGKGVGGDGKTRHLRNHADGGKVSATAFAAESGIDANKIRRYLDAWGKAADAGHVPPAASLSPDTEPDLDTEALPDWGGFYVASVLSNNSPGRRAAIERQAAADGVSPITVATVAHNPSALKAAIKADQPTAAAATEALLTDPATAERTLNAARAAVIRQYREQAGLPPKTSTKEERVTHIEEVCDRVIRDLAEVLDPHTDPLGQRLALLADNLDALGEYHRHRLDRAVIKLTARVAAWEDRVRGLTGHTVAG